MIFHIAEQGDWRAAQAGRLYHPASLQPEGFIHCSTSRQIARVADEFFPGRHGLLLLQIDETRLTAPLKWEPAAGTSGPPGLFPHLYGPLNLDAVIQVLDFEPRADGSFDLSNSL
jgi:uncharacterized protein (DUF952 family)